MKNILEIIKSHLTMNELKDFGIVLAALLQALKFADYLREKREADKAQKIESEQKKKNDIS